MKKVLIVTSVISMIEWFHKDIIDFLKFSCGCDVHLAVNLDFMEDTDIKRTVKYVEKLMKIGIILHNIHFVRNPLNKENFKAYLQLKKIIYKYHYDLVHCHTPTASMLTRLAARRARKTGTIVMYTSHGFHFHNSAPIKNWILYYPIEKFLALYTDTIVTINKEDYKRTRNFSVKNRRYIPGVGVDIEKIKNIKVNKADKKESIGVPSDAILVLSIGELIERKNHEVILEAISKINRYDIYYAICGRGPLKNYLLEKAKKLNIADRFILLGFRKDIGELCHAADISAFPSKIEGLGLAGIEAMSAGVPLVSSNIHGIVDYTVNGKTGFTYPPTDVKGFARGIEKLARSVELRQSMKDSCIEAVKPFEIKNALKQMQNIYIEILNINLDTSC
jgi:glycosyltransferase involved in cell wall biosynthesis